MMLYDVFYFFSRMQLDGFKKIPFWEINGFSIPRQFSCKGVFVHADPGFDSEELKQICSDHEIELNVKQNPRNQKQQSDECRYFDEQPYKIRTKIEHANAWTDAFKALLIRYEKLTETWMAMQWLTLITLFCRKIKV